MVVSFVFCKLREYSRWWKLVGLSIITAFVLMSLSSFSNVKLHPVSNLLPSTNLRFFSEEVNQLDQFGSTDEEVKEGDTEVENSKNYGKAIHLMRELDEAERLYKEVRLLCYVLMYPAAHNTTAKHIKATWGKRCNRLIFMSTQDDPSVGAIDVGSREGYHSLWNKTRCSLTYIYKNLLYDYEWFVKADSDTYVLADNLRYFLQAYDTNDPIYFGQHYKVYGGYNSGGAGYVLGREAVRRFVEQAIPNTRICMRERRKGEDVGLGHCLQRTGVTIGDSRDHLGQERFWQLHPTWVMDDPRARNRLQRYPIRQGETPEACCSETLVSFHKMTVPELYLMDYLIFKVRAFGHIPTLPIRPKLPPNVKVIPEKTLEKYRQYEDITTTEEPEKNLTLSEPLN